MSEERFSRRSAVSTQVNTWYYVTLLLCTTRSVQVVHSLPCCCFPKTLKKILSNAVECRTAVVTMILLCTAVVSLSTKKSCRMPHNITLPLLSRAALLRPFFLSPLTHPSRLRASPPILRAAHPCARTNSSAPYPAPASELLLPPRKAFVLSSRHSVHPRPPLKDLQGSSARKAAQHLLFALQTCRATRRPPRRRFGVGRCVILRISIRVWWCAARLFSGRRVWITLASSLSSGMYVCIVKYVSMYLFMYAVCMYVTLCLLFLALWWHHYANAGGHKR